MTGVAEVRRSSEIAQRRFERALRDRALRTYMCSGPDALTTSMNSLGGFVCEHPTK